MKKQLTIQPHSVSPVKLPTLFAEFNTDLTVYEKAFTDCSGCENVGAPDSVINFLSTAIKSHPELVWDHWNPQDKNLRGKIAKLHNVDIDQVFITSGALAGIDYCFRIFTREGTHTGFCKPEWPGFEHYADFHRNTKFYLENFTFPFTMGAPEISQFVKKNDIKFMIFSNPVPLQGHMRTEKEIEQILEDNRETIFVIDEADTITPEKQTAHLATRHSNAIFLGSLSKFYGLSGLRIGYLISPREHIMHFKNTINVIEVSSLAVLAGNVVFDDQKYLKQTQKNVRQSMQYLKDGVEGTSFEVIASPDCFAAYIYSEKMNPKKELEKYGIKILEGQYFGLPWYVNGGRFNLSNPAHAKIVAKKLKEIDKKQKNIQA